MAETDRKNTDWRDVADWYDQLVGESGSEYHKHVVLPGTLRLLGDAKKVVDIACGQGVLCRLLRERGVEVTGVDLASTLIDAARERGPGDIHYHVGDARDLSFLPESQFDAAACLLAIQNIHPIAPVFTSAARLLQPMGRFVIVMMHPCFRGPKETSWGWEGNAVQYRRVDRYLLPRKNPIVTHPGKKDEQYTWTFHKPIEAYVKAARQAGLLIDAIEEWPSHKTSTRRGHGQRRRMWRGKEIPMFMAMRCVKFG